MKISLNYGILEIETISGKKKKSNQIRKKIDLI